MSVSFSPGSQNRGGRVAAKRIMVVASDAAGPVLLTGA